MPASSYFDMPGDNCPAEPDRCQEKGSRVLALTSEG